MPPRRVRLDAELVRRGLAASRTQAQDLIAQRRVTVAGAPARKASTQVDPDAPITVAPGPPAYASRGGHKLAGALDAFGIDVAGRVALDAGAAHGGFTDVLLQRGAARVVAVDVGYGQLDQRLRRDPRVVVRERTNVRTLQPSDVGPPAPDLVVADLSFISLVTVLPALVAVAAPDADHVLLVKPQFEAGRERVGRGGVVRDSAVWLDVLRRVAAAAAGLGRGVAGACVSPLPGPAGNVEFFLHLRPAGDPRLPADVELLLAAAVADGRRLARDGTAAIGDAQTSG
ncbi:MAG TPA: TlyA family RNA methyltransferase [Egibacteraceae bacterium]